MLFRRRSPLTRPSADGGLRPHSRRGDDTTTLSITVAPSALFTKNTKLTKATQRKALVSLFDGLQRWRRRASRGGRSERRPTTNRPSNEWRLVVRRPSLLSTSARRPTSASAAEAADIQPGLCALCELSGAWCFAPKAQRESRRVVAPSCKRGAQPVDTFAV